MRPRSEPLVAAFVKQIEENPSGQNKTRRRQSFGLKLFFFASRYVHAGSKTSQHSRSRKKMASPTASLAFTSLPSSFFCLHEQQRQIRRRHLCVLYKLSGRTASVLPQNHSLIFRPSSAERACVRPAPRPACRWAWFRAFDAAPPDFRGRCARSPSWPQ